MVHNGYDYARKKGFGKVRVGKQICPICEEEHREDKGFWKGLLSRWQETVTDLIKTLRDSHVAWEKISGVMNFIIPICKDKARYLFNDSIEQFSYTQDNYVIVNYDEQKTQKEYLDKIEKELGPEKFQEFLLEQAGLK